MQRRVSFVLPVARENTGRDDLDVLRMQLLVRSFLRFFHLPDLAEFWIITPDRDHRAVEDAVRALTTDVRFQIISEEELTPITKGAKDGWSKQQLIKLAIPKHITSEHYVTFDSDVICVRDFSYQDLLIDGKAKCNVETINDYVELYTADFAAEERQIKQQRVEWAERVLRHTRQTAFRDIYYGETPVVMVTDEVRQLNKHIEQLYQRPWQEALWEALPWTEYPLYFQFLEGKGVLDQRYQRSHRNTVMRFDQTLWQYPSRYRIPRSLETLDVKNIFSNENNMDGFFIVIQSWLGLPLERIAAAVMPYLD